MFIIDICANFFAILATNVSSIALRGIYQNCFAIFRLFFELLSLSCWSFNLAQAKMFCFRSFWNDEDKFESQKLVSLMIGLLFSLQVLFLANLSSSWPPFQLQVFLLLIPSCSLNINVAHCAKVFNAGFLPWSSTSSSLELNFFVDPSNHYSFINIFDIKMKSKDFMHNTSDFMVGSLFSGFLKSVITAWPFAETSSLVCIANK